MESRITDLEIKLSYMEDQMDELNRTVFRQQQQIDLLISNIRDLREMMQNSSGQGQIRNLRDEIPPHY